MTAAELRLRLASGATRLTSLVSALDCEARHAQELGAPRVGEHLEACAKLVAACADLVGRQAEAIDAEIRLRAVELADELADEVPDGRPPYRPHPDGRPPYRPHPDGCRCRTCVQGKAWDAVGGGSSSRVLP